MIIKRARGNRLYTTKGQKILDLSMDNGRAVLGHRPNGLSLNLKNVIDRGLYAHFDNIYISRIVKDLNKRFPDHPYFTILEYEDKITQIVKDDIKDPLFEVISDAVISYWRPFLPIPDSCHLVVLYPIPGLNTVSIIVSKENLPLESDKISPILLAGILRSMYDYDLFQKKWDIKEFNDYKNIPNSKLIPPYLILNKDKESYEKLILKAKDSDILLNDKKQIVVLSNDFSSGEKSKILEILG